MEEVWKGIPGYEQYYEASSIGNVRRIKRSLKNRGMLNKHLSKCISGNGYLAVSLFSEGKPKRLFYIHRLVAATFIDNPENKKEVNHKNGIKTDNTIANLEWVTAKENTRHSLQMGFKDQSNTWGENHPKALLNTEKVKCILFEWENGERDIKKIATQYRVSKKAIEKVVKRLTWKHVIISTATSHTPQHHPAGTGWL